MPKGLRPALISWIVLALTPALSASGSCANHSYCASPSARCTDREFGEPRGQGCLDNARSRRPAERPGRIPAQAHPYREGSAWGRMAPRGPERDRVEQRALRLIQIGFSGNGQARCRALGGHGVRSLWRENSKGLSVITVRPPGNRWERLCGAARQQLLGGR